MAAGTTRIADVIVPEIFTPYVQQLTEEKSRLVRSGVVARDAELDSFLAGGGLTMNAPSWKDLDNDEENVSSDDPAVESTPNKIGTTQEVVVRLSRNNSWKTADLTSALAGSDPADAIAGRVADYWVRRAQAAFVAMMKGVFADNAAAPTGVEHTQNDMTHDVSGASFVDGVTNFSAEAFIDAAVTMGDSMQDLGIMFVHSIVYARMQKNNMIDMVPDATQQILIPTFLGREVIVDDAGTETLYNRVEWCMHPIGHAYVGTAPNGGPTNAATSNNLAHADSWRRAFAERKQIKIARLITRES
jgi:hypothetical protein